MALTTENIQLIPTMMPKGSENMHGGKAPWVGPHIRVHHLPRRVIHDLERESATESARGGLEDIGKGACACGYPCVSLLAAN